MVLIFRFFIWSFPNFQVSQFSFAYFYFAVAATKDDAASSSSSSQDGRRRHLSHCFNRRFDDDNDDDHDHLFQMFHSFKCCRRPFHSRLFFYTFYNTFYTFYSFLFVLKDKKKNKKNPKKTYNANKSLTEIRCYVLALPFFLSFSFFSLFFNSTHSFIFLFFLFFFQVLFFLFHPQQHPTLLIIA